MCSRGYYLPTQTDEASFIFAFIGSSNSSQVSFVDTADQLIGTENDLLPGNIDILKEYIVNAPFVKNVPFITSDFALGVLDSLTKSVTWVVRLLAVNRAYFERNPGEVIAGMALAALLAAEKGNRTWQCRIKPE